MSTGSGHRTSTGTAPVPRMAAIAHSRFLFFSISRNRFSPSGLRATLGGHTQVTSILATNTSTISNISCFNQSSPGSANCMFCSQTGYSTFSHPKILLLWPGPSFCLSISGCLQTIVSAVRNCIHDPQIVVKMGKSKKAKKTQAMYLLDGNSLFTIRFGAPLNSLSVYLFWDIEFMSFWFVIQDMWSYIQQRWNFITRQMLLLL